MSHLIFVAEGLKEGIAEFEARMDRAPFKHAPARLREIKIYDLQFDNRDHDEVMNEFKFDFSEHTFDDTPSMEFKQHISPVKHGKIRALINLIMNFARPFGFRPVKPHTYKEGDKPSKIRKKLVNFYMVAEADDLFFKNKVHEREEEYL